MKRYLFVLLLCSFNFIMWAQMITTDNDTYQYGDKVSVKYSACPTGSNFYFYQNVSKVPSIFYKQSVTFDSDEFSFSTFEPGFYIVQNELDDQIFAQTSFTIQDLPLANENLRIFLIADAHVMAKSLVLSEGDAYNKAMESNRKMLAVSEDVYNQLIDSVIKYKPDLVLLPGDMTKDGEKLSHDVVISGLDRLAKAGIRSLVIPGNHDYNNPNSVFYASAESFYTPTITESEFAQMYANYGYGEGCVRDTASLSFYTDEFPKLRIIGIDATRNRENTLKEWGADRDRSYGDGLLRDNTLQWLIDRADEADANGRMVLVMMHHQLLQHFNNQDKIFSSATIKDGESVAQILIDHKIRTILTGHMHINNISKYYNTSHTDSIIEISTGSPIEYPGCFRWLTLNENRTELTINTRYIKSTDQIEDYMLHGRDVLSGHADILWSPMSRMLWNGMKTMRSNSIGSTPPISTFLDTMINDEQAYSDMAYLYLSNPLILLMLTASEANENYKYGDWIISKLSSQLTAFTEEVIKAGSYNMLEKAALRAFIQQYANTAFKDYLNSLITDCSYCTTENENTTNDLYLTLQLPLPEIISGLENEQVLTVGDDYYYDLLGRRYQSLPTQQGVYLHNGQKIFVK